MRVAFVGPRGLDVDDTPPWSCLVEALGETHEICPVAQAQGMVVVNHQWGPLRIARQRGIPSGRLAMVMLEPVATLPEHGSLRIMRRYGLVLCGSPRWASHLGAECFPWPQALGNPRGGVNLDLQFRYQATMVAGQKRSGLASSQYGLRRETLRALAESALKVGLAGPGWDDSAMRQMSRAVAVSARALAFSPSHFSMTESFGRSQLTGIDYVGPVEDKFAFMRQAPVAIVIENSSDYISEKLVDALVAGVAPVFVGPSLREFGFPEGIAIHAEPDSHSIAATVARLSRQDIEGCIRAGQGWLKSPGAAELEANKVFKRIGDRLRRYFADSA